VLYFLSDISDTRNPAYDTVDDAKELRNKRNSSCDKEPPKKKMRSISSPSHVKKLYDMPFPAKTSRGELTE